MIKLTTDATISEIPANIKKKNTDTDMMPTQQAAVVRPDVVDAKVYKLKSAFVKNSVFVTLSYINEGEAIRPVEIFINSKDLTRAPEYVVLTRLISAIFRRASDAMFILEELQGIFDPNGGSFKEGKYYHSFYAEIADVIERFFYDVGIVDKPVKHPASDNGSAESSTLLAHDEGNMGNVQFKVCPDCNNRTLKIENGCDSCMGCGYSKCDK